MQNLAWSTGDAELTTHLETIILGGVMSATVLRHQDRRSRGSAKVVVQAPMDVDTVIEELHICRQKLDRRTLELQRDRLRMESERCECV